MKKLFKHLRVLSVAAAVALAAQPLALLGTSTPAHATIYTDGGSNMMMGSVLGGGGGGTSGGWIIGGIFISVASIIACAMIVGAEEGREMTLEEALLSGAIPLGCLFREHLPE